MSGITWEATTEQILPADPKGDNFVTVRFDRDQDGNSTPVNDVALIDWNGRVLVSLQARLQLPEDEGNWPTWRGLQLVRHEPGGKLNPTAGQDDPITPKRSAAFLYGPVEMDVDPDTGLRAQFRWNALAEGKLIKAIYKIRPYIQEVVAR